MHPRLFLGQTTWKLSGIFCAVYSPVYWCPLWRKLRTYASVKLEKNITRYVCQGGFRLLTVFIRRRTSAQGSTNLTSYHPGMPFSVERPMSDSVTRINTATAFCIVSKYMQKSVETQWYARVKCQTNASTRARFQGFFREMSYCEDMIIRHSSSSEGGERTHDNYQPPPATSNASAQNKTGATYTPYTTVLCLQRDARP